MPRFPQSAHAYTATRILCTAASLYAAQFDGQRGLVPGAERRARASPFCTAGKPCHGKHQGVGKPSHRVPIPHKPNKTIAEVHKYSLEDIRGQVRRDLGHFAVAENRGKVDVYEAPLECALP